MYRKELIISQYIHPERGIQNVAHLTVKPPGIQHVIATHPLKKKVVLSWGEWFMCWQTLAHLHKTNIPIHQGLEILKCYGSRRFQDVFGWVVDLLNQGHSLSEALHAVFSIPLLLSPLLKSPNLDSSFFESISRFCERQHSYQNSVKQKLRYPVSMILLIGCLAMVQVVWVIPNLPEGHIETSSLWSWGVYPALLMVGFFYLAVYKKPANIFFRFLDLALSAGLTEHEAISFYAEHFPKSAAFKISNQLKRGASWHEAIHCALPSSIAQWISLHHDQLKFIAQHVADLVEAQEDAKTKRLLIWTQSALIFMMGFMVLHIASITLLPLYENLDYALAQRS